MGIESPKLRQPVGHAVTPCKKSPQTWGLKDEPLLRLAERYWHTCKKSPQTWGLKEISSRIFSCIH